MGNINPQYNDRVQYILKSKTLGSIVTIEPIGWTDDDKEYTRHEKYDGIVAKFSNSLKFIGDAKDYILFIYDIDGIMGDIELIRNEKHPHTDIWTLTYSGFLDLSTLSQENNQVLVKFNSGGLEQELKARDSESVEVDRLTTFNDTRISELKTVEVELEGRRIFLQTKLATKASDNSVKLSNSTKGNTRGSTIAIPLSLVNKSHESAQAPLNGALAGDNSWERSGRGTVSNLFFAISDEDRDLRVNIKLEFKVSFDSYDDVNFFRFWARLGKYTGKNDLNFKENYTLFTSDNYEALNGNTFKASFYQTIRLLEGESLALVFDQCYDGKNGKKSHLDIRLLDITCTVDVEEDSSANTSITKAVLAHELADRLVSIATNREGAFYSDYFGRKDLGYPVDGKGAFIGFTHGFWVRRFDKIPLPQEETTTQDKVSNLFKPITTSFNDFTTSTGAVLNIGIGIETIGNKEIVRIEDKSYFYNRNVTIRLPNQVKNVKRTIAVDKYYSALDIGYEKGGDYEEAFGLDEFNVKSNFSTVISRLKNVYTQISKYRADSYGMEFARRKPITLNDTEDTSYDEDVFFLDLKRGPSSIFLQRKWGDDFEKLPTGIFSPETATNLRFSPVNCLLRHGWWISASLIKYATAKLKFGSSTANRLLKTKLIGGKEYAENGDIINSELQTARFIPEEIEFEHVCDFDVMQQINGSTTILGKKVLNLYGLIEFINEKGEKERAFFMNLKPNGKGQFKVLKLNR
ncbi:hypothetical protein IUY40_02680 [Flavobacterium sp. ALJ2]|uniref:hypothetical protein n=1 Tax=Flavobacterium sp. ALJ2 TaxID=2786960 RepID=UPI00189CB9C7|nr:hypothetical protein [Flavobacterium sp. ALJ2]MBF7090450.1 hypothetical protein [Flavobacterium sp. ALJ2]